MSYTISNDGVHYTESAVKKGIVYLQTDLLNFDKYFPLIVNGRRFDMYREPQAYSTYVITISFDDAFTLCKANTNSITYYISCRDSDLQEIENILIYDGKYDWFSDGYNFWSNIQIPLFNLSRNDLNKFEFMLPANYYMVNKKVKVEPYFG
jgi:hypothetical protein